VGSDGTKHGITSSTAFHLTLCGIAECQNANGEAFMDQWLRILAILSTYNQQQQHYHLPREDVPVPVYAKNHDVVGSNLLSSSAPTA